VREIRTLGLTRRELEIGYGADIETLSTERESKLLRPTCSHYASSRPYDWGLAPLGPQGARDVLEIIDDRIGIRSTLIASQLPIADWHRTIAEPPGMNPYARWCGGTGARRLLLPDCARHGQQLSGESPRRGWQQTYRSQWQGCLR